MSGLTGIATEDIKLAEFLVRLVLLGGRPFEPHTEFAHGEYQGFEGVNTKYFLVQ